MTSMSEMVEKVARALMAEDVVQCSALRPNVSVEKIADYAKEAADAGSYQAMARAALEAITLPEIDEDTFHLIEEVAARKMRQWARGYAPQDIRIEHSLSWWIAKEVEARMRAALSEEAR